jgi:hypothetical protein
VAKALDPGESRALIVRVSAELNRRLGHVVE